MSDQRRWWFTVLAIWREGRPIRRGMPGIALRFGDALLIQGPRSRLPILQAEPDLIVMGAELQRPAALRPRKVWIATGIVAATLIAAAAGLLPTAEAVLVAVGRSVSDGTAVLVGVEIGCRVAVPVRLGVRVAVGVRVVERPARRHDTW